MADGGGLGGGFDWKGGSYPGTGGDLRGDAVARRALHGRRHASRRRAAGHRSSTLLVFYYDGANTPVRQAGAVGDRDGQGAAADHRLEQRAAAERPRTRRPTTTAPTGQPREHTFTVTNWGAATATMIADGGTLGGGFGWTGGAAFGGGTCGATLGAGRELHGRA